MSPSNVVGDLAFRVDLDVECDLSPRMGDLFELGLFPQLISSKLGVRMIKHPSRRVRRPTLRLRGWPRSAADVPILLQPFVRPSLSINMNGN